MTREDIESPMSLSQITEIGRTSSMSKKTPGINKDSWPKMGALSSMMENDGTTP